jgi:hypothetical protein
MRQAVHDAQAPSAPQTFQNWGKKKRLFGAFSVKGFLPHWTKPILQQLCDGWVCGLGVVGASLVFGLVRGAGAFDSVLPSFALVSGIPFAQHNRDFGHFFTTHLLCDVRQWSVTSSRGL